MPIETRNSRGAVAAEGEPGVGTSSLPYTTQWHRDHGRESRCDKDIKQSLSTTHEEQALVDFVLRPDCNASPVRVKDLLHHEAILLRRRAAQSEREALSEVLALCRKSFVSGTLD